MADSAELRQRRGIHALGQRAIDYYVDTGLCVFCEADDLNDVPHEDDCEVGKLSGVKVDAARKGEKASQRAIADAIIARDAAATPGTELPATNSIKLYMHCTTCMKTKPVGVSPREWAQIEVGWTLQGIQIWCKRCEVNVCHIDFQGQRHPANTQRLNVQEIQ